MLLALTTVLSVSMTACNFGGGSDEDSSVVQVTPTPEPTKAAKATPTPAPANAQNTTYTSKNKAVSIKLPDATWANKSDSDDMLSFESPKQGKLLILQRLHRLSNRGDGAHRPLERQLRIFQTEFIDAFQKRPFRILRAHPDQIAAENVLHGRNIPHHDGGQRYHLFLVSVGWFRDSQDDARINVRKINARRQRLHLAYGFCFGGRGGFLNRSNLGGRSRLCGSRSGKKQGEQTQNQNAFFHFHFILSDKLTRLALRRLKCYSI